MAITSWQTQKLTDTNLNMAKIAVIGTGNMGAPMAINLSAANHRVRAFDIVASKMRALEPHGITAAASHHDAVDGAEIIITMLPTAVEVKQVYVDEIFLHGNKGCTLIDSSTIDLKDAKEIHRRAREYGFNMIDAPVSGGTVGAATGNLTFMVGGEQQALSLAAPVLDIMGATTIHCGAAGMGQAAKMCNNMMLGIQMASVVEGFHLAKRVGLTNAKLFEVATSSSGNCWSLTAFCPVPDLAPASPANNNFQAGFATDLMLKDMGIALNAAKEVDLDLEVAPVAAEIYRHFSQMGNGELDFSAIYKLLE